MNTEFFNALDALEKERGIPKEYMLEKVEAALISAFKRDNGGRTNVRVVLNPEKRMSKFTASRRLWRQWRIPKPRFRSRMPKDRQKISDR